MRPLACRFLVLMMVAVATLLTLSASIWLIDERCFSNADLHCLSSPTYTKYQTTRKPQDLSIQEAQQIINKYITILSSQNYGTFNKDIVIDSYKFHRFSAKYVHSVMKQKSLIISGDSLCRHFFDFMAFTMYHYLLDDIDSFNTTNLHYNRSLTLTEHIWKTILDLGILNNVAGNGSKAVSIGPPVLRKSFACNYSDLAYIADGLQSSKQIRISNVLKVISSSKTLHPSFKHTVFVDFSAQHMSHLIPSRPWEKNAVHNIRHFESFMSEYIHAVIGAEHNNQTQNQTKCVIVRPPNPVCTSAYVNDWSPLGVFYETELPRLNGSALRTHPKMKQCMNQIRTQQLNATANSTVPTVIEICANYTLTSVGPLHLKKRMEQFVYRSQHAIFAQYGVRLLYYDQHQLFANRCEYTWDGRHYNPLLAVEAMAVLNIMDKWCA